MFEEVDALSGIAWQPFGGIEGFTYGNGIAHSRTYDLSGRVTGIASGAVQQLAYQWDATDNITAITDLVDGTKSQSFGYDGLYRLTAASGAYGNLGYGYDALGNRTALTVDGTVTTYTYAPDSNRLTTVDDGTGPVNFEYDAAGNTLTDGSRTFSYDARNRMTAADGHAYGYNALGQRAFKPRFQTVAPGDADGDGVIDQNDLLALRDMIKGEIPASPGADCNGDGAIDNQDTNCIARQIGMAKNKGKGKNSEPETATVTTTATNSALTQVGWVLFAYDAAGHLIGEYDEQGNPIRRYVWLEDLPVAMISAEGIHYLHADHLNTPKVVTDSSGAIVWQADYRPFGETDIAVENIEFNLRFAGQYFDGETELHQNYFRNYDPSTGRYNRPDPIGFVGGTNNYRYANASPVMFFDRLGLYPDCKRFQIGVERRSWERYEDDVLLRQVLPVPVPTGGSPAASPSLISPTQPPIRPGIDVELWLVEYMLVNRKAYQVEQVIQIWKQFCVETRTDECGNETTYRTSSEYSKELDPYERLIDERIRWTHEMLKKLGNMTL